MPRPRSRHSTAPPRAKSDRVPRQERSRAIVEALLEAAARVFANEGYERTSTNRIAEVAGVGIASLYEYFAGKDDLLSALLERECSRLEDLIASLGSYAELPLPAAVAAVIRAYFSAFAAHPQTTLILHQHAARLRCSARLIELRRATIAEVARALAAREELAGVPDMLSVSIDLVYIVEALLLSGVYEDVDAAQSDVRAQRVAELVLTYLAAIRERHRAGP